VWVADFVLGSYGSGAVMSVPGHDARDYEFAQKFGLPIRRVVAPAGGGGEGAGDEGLPLTEEGVTVASANASGLDLNGLPTAEAKAKARARPPPPPPLLLLLQRRRLPSAAPPAALLATRTHPTRARTLTRRGTALPARTPPGRARAGDGVAGGAGAGEAAGQFQAAGLAVRAPAVLGRALPPDLPRGSHGGRRAAGLGTAAGAAPHQQLQALRYPGVPSGGD